uniref:Uncharacterized protein n=1 Tax=Tetraselmis sp. GSL018 TaxID=582737 RepID=A0A061QSQ3_9CHLO
MHFEADNGPRALCKLCDGLKLKSWTSAPQGLSRLPFGLQVQCLCYHPQRPLIAVGLERCLGEYNYLTGAKLGCTQFFASPVALSYLPDGNAVAVLTQNGGITAWSTVTWRSRTVCTPVEKLSGSKGLSEGFLAVGHNLLFFAGFMRTTVRCAMWEPGAGPKKPIRLKLDSSKKPVAGLQCPPSGKQLYVAYADCTVRGFNVGSNTPIFSLSVPVKDARPPSGAAAATSSSLPTATAASARGRQPTGSSRRASGWWSCRTRRPSWASGSARRPRP